MTFHAASREALAAAELALLDVLGGTDTKAAAKPARGRSRAKATPAAFSAEQLGDELFAVVRMLDSEAGLRRALSDASAAPQRREQLLTGLLQGQVADATLTLLVTVVTARWSTPRELVDGLEELGGTALLVHAEREGRLDAVEDELFRFGRIVAAEGTLEQALSDRAAPRDSKLSLVRELLGDRADPITVRLVEQLVTAPRGRGVVDGLSQLSEAAAKRREQSVAYVVSPGPLSQAQQERLSATLRRIYARPIALHVAVDPSIQGGLVVRVGDEVIDGSATGRIDELRRRFAG